MDYFVRDVKADSSEWVHSEFDRLFEWQKGYGAFSVSPTAVESVRRYVANQRQHHSGVDFKTEYRELLTKADIKFEEKYLW